MTDETVSFYVEKEKNQKTKEILKNVRSSLILVSQLGKIQTG